MDGCMEITLSRESCKGIVDQQGWDTFLTALDDRTGRKLDLYTVSTDWYENGMRICKAKGARGDLLVVWS